MSAQAHPPDSAPGSQTEVRDPAVCRLRHDSSVCTVPGGLLQFCGLQLYLVGCIQNLVPVTSGCVKGTSV